MNVAHDQNDAESRTEVRAGNRRAYAIEILGILSGIGFFIGVFFAFQTYTAGLVTQREFDRLQPGQTIAEANDVLGFEGRLLDAPVTKTEQASGQPSQVVRWENSTISFVECEFRDGILTAKSATELPY